MNRGLLPLVFGIAVGLAMTTTAAADEVDPNFLSKLRAVTPEVRGLEVEVVNRGDEFELKNETGKALLIRGYSGEPYLRFLPDGTVLENRRSPTTYLNKDRYATQPVPPSAKADAKPQWKRVSREASYEWHDHRIHYMGKGTPRQVEDESERQKVFDWRVAMRLGGQPVAATGTLFWIPTPGSDEGGGAPWAVIAGVLIVLAMALTLWRRRRLAPAGGAAAPREAPGTSEKESW
jgi:hypothetical protein